MLTDGAERSAVIGSLLAGELSSSSSSSSSSSTSLPTLSTFCPQPPPRLHQNSTLFTSLTNTQLASFSAIPKTDYLCCYCQKETSTECIRSLSCSEWRRHWQRLWWQNQTTPHWTGIGGLTDFDIQYVLFISYLLYKLYIANITLRRGGIWNLAQTPLTKGWLASAKLKKNTRSAWIWV